MAICARKQRRVRTVCVGSLNKLITLQDRAISTPSGDGVDYGESFTDTNDVWADIETKVGETIFDSTNIERDVTHYFHIRFISGITAETWIEWDSVKYDILDVENLNEESRFLLLRATSRGVGTKEVNLS